MTLENGVRSAISSLVNRGLSGGAYFWNATSLRTDPKCIGQNWKSYINGIYKITTVIGKTTYFCKVDSKAKAWP